MNAFRGNKEWKAAAPHPGPAAVTRAASWQPSVYAPPPSDRPKALAMTTLIFAMVVAGLFLEIGRSRFVVSNAAAPLVVSLIPLASPPRQKHDIEKPAPQQRQANRPARPEAEQVPKPAVALLKSPGAPLPIPPSTTPMPKLDEDAAPKAIPAPPAPQLSSNAADTSWRAQVLARLAKHRRYPFGAQGRREQGVPYVRFVMDRDGEIVSVQLERSSGFPDLDHEAMSLPKRAQPLPKPPTEVKGDTIELVVPVEFFIH